VARNVVKLGTILRVLLSPKLDRWWTLPGHNFHRVAGLHTTSPLSRITRLPDGEYWQHAKRYRDGPLGLAGHFEQQNIGVGGPNSRRSEQNWGRIHISIAQTPCAALLEAW
jgi:hypothetical protein